MNPHCPVCDRISSPGNPLAVYQNPRVALYHMSGIDLPGYLVLAPVRHVEHAGELDDPELSEFARVQARAVRVILGIPGVRKVYACSFGEVVPHLHIHLFPRTDAMLEDPDGFTDGYPDGPRIFDRWRRALAVPAETDEVLSQVTRLREHFMSLSLQARAEPKKLR